MQAPEDFKKWIEDLKNTLRASYEVSDFVGLTAGTPKDVYMWDIHECVAKCDAFVAICDYPSIGLGYEMGVAVEKLKKPTLALARKDSKISRMVLGVDQPHYRFERYDSMEEIPELVKKFLAR